MQESNQQRKKKRITGPYYQQTAHHLEILTEKNKNNKAGV